MLKEEEAKRCQKSMEKVTTNQKQLPNLFIFKLILKSAAVGMLHGHGDCLILAHPVA